MRIHPQVVSEISHYKTDNLYPIYIGHDNSLKTKISLLLKRLLTAGVFFRLPLFDSVAFEIYHLVSIFADFSGASIRA
jgi:hypothetical protein